MRAFMRTAFPLLVNILCILSIIGVFIIATAFADMIGGGSFLILFIGMVVVVLSFGVIYVLLDIRDSLLKIQEIVSQHHERWNSQKSYEDLQKNVE